MDRMDFTQGVVRTRILEKRLLSKDKFERMIDTKDVYECINLLNDTDYGEPFSNMRHIQEYENILADERARVYEMMREISPDKRVVDLLSLQYDYHNLKVLLKEFIFNKDFTSLYIPIGTIDFKKLKSALTANDLNDIESDIKKVIQTVLKDFEEKRDPQRIELIVDHYYGKHLFQLAESMNVSLFIDYVQAMIDFINIRSVIRIQKQKKNIHFLEDVLLPNGTIEKEAILYSINDTVNTMLRTFKNASIAKSLIKGLESYQQTKQLSAFEKEMDNYLLDLARESKYVVFGPEPLFTYILAKETEIKNLRIVIVSKINQISSEITRERLRDLYA